MKAWNECHELAQKKNHWVMISLLMRSLERLWLGFCSWCGPTEGALRLSTYEIQPKSPSGNRWCGRSTTTSPEIDRGVHWEYASRSEVTPDDQSCPNPNSELQIMMRKITRVRECECLRCQPCPRGLILVDKFTVVIFCDGSDESGTGKSIIVRCCQCSIYLKIASKSKTREETTHRRQKPHAVGFYGSTQSLKKRKFEVLMQSTRRHPYLWKLRVRSQHATCVLAAVES